MQNVEEMKKLTFLGSRISSDRRSKKDIICRINQTKQGKPYLQVLESHWRLGREFYKLTYGVHYSTGLRRGYLQLKVI